jgi:leucyl aminopeptidase
MTTLSLAGGSAATTKADVLLIGATKGAKGPVLTPGARDVDAAFGGKLAAALADAGFTGGAEETVRIPTLGAIAATSVVAVGLGDEAKLDLEVLRRAAGAGTRAAAGAKKLVTTLAQAKVGGGDADALVRAVGEGLLLGAYEFTRFRTQRNGHKPAVQQVVVLTTDPKAKGAAEAVKRATAVAESVALTRDLVNTPPGDLHPADLAAVATERATAAGCTVEVMDEKALRKGKYGGILGVGQGSANGPRLVRIEYRHPKATKTLALVGKGITFDSGGLSLKPAASMEWMKSDMAGAAAVIATMCAIGRIKPRVNVTGWVPTAENMPSGSAIRPGDVLSMYSGKRVEVLNTDAEGRLILADALARAAEEGPAAMVDVATLTGAQLVALGARTAGVMANDDDFRTTVVDAAGRAGEAMWPMPLPPELRKSIDSEIADITNTGDRYGGMLVAGVFLREFVPADIPWAHLDIAGPAYNNDQPWGYTPKGGTGAAVRTLVQLAEDLAAQ